jgi:mRNA interferase HigB
MIKYADKYSQALLKSCTNGNFLVILSYCMKVHLIREESIAEFTRYHSRSSSSFDTFLEHLEEADWKVPDDIKRTFSYSDLVCEGERVVFNIGGNTYRMICGLKFRTNVVILFIKFIGTHAAYTKLCKAKKNEIGICSVDMFKS